MSATTIPGSSLGNYTVIQTFVASDACGNLSSRDWTIEVFDDVPPVMVVPNDTIVGCDEFLGATPPAIEDGCGVATWSSQDSIVPGDCPGWYTILRTYTGQDDALNEVSDLQILQVVDTVAPEFTFVPAAVILECSEPVVLDSAQATDACSGLNLTSTLDTLLNLGANQYTLQVTWTATDLCGNTSQAVQDILILDQEAPTLLEAPDDAVLSFGDPLPINDWAEQFVYFDNCQDIDDLSLSYWIDTLETPVPCVDFVQIDWTLQDLAGNSTNHTQLIQLTDDDAPVWIEVAENLDLSCGDLWEVVDPLLEDHNEFEWSVEIDTIPGICAAQDLILVQFMAEDVCGNVSDTMIQEIQYSDSLAPEAISTPEDLMLTSTADIPDCDPEFTTWQDNCSEVQVECVTDTLNWECPGTFVLERTFIATDACGNASTATQLISVEDLEAPEWVSAPEDALLSCDSVLEALLPEELLVLDNESALDEIDVILASSVEEGDNCGWTLTNVYEATDGCGNMTSTAYTIAWVDSTAPTLASPLDDLELICLSEIPSCEDALVDGVDDCNDWNWYCDDEFEGGGCDGPDCTLIRTIHLLDACENESTVQQTIVVSEPPTVPELPSGISPNGDEINDLYMIANVGPNMGFPPCDWLTNTRLMVFDRWGSVVFESTDVTTPWDGTNLNGQPLPVGTYFVVFETQGATYKQTVDLRR
jgi:gliding motility-associated-like protein